MAGTLRKITQFSKTVNCLTKLVANVSISSNCSLQSIVKNNIKNIALFHTSMKQYDTAKAVVEEKKEEKKETKKVDPYAKNPKGLMEFFDDPKNWGVQKVKAGRAWKKEELRLKSNEDLHKLWFVLLKERNMLKTMEYICNEEVQLFPNPERIDKVEISMENLELVIRERNNAYYMLETGEHGERPSKMVNSPLGLKYWYRERQYRVPRFFNSKFRETHCFQYGGYAVHKFRRLYFEKLWNEKRREINRNKTEIYRIFRNFPNVEMEAIQAKFPHFTIEQLKKLKSYKRSNSSVVP